MKSDFAVLARVRAQPEARLGIESREISLQIDATPMRGSEMIHSPFPGIQFTARGRSRGLTALAST